MAEHLCGGPFHGKGAAMGEQEGRQIFFFVKTPLDM